MSSLAFTFVCKSSINQNWVTDSDTDFFPNDDMNQGRRKRIIKAMEYGATWQKDWNASVTHIIVDIDDNMKWPSVIKHLSTKGGLGSQELPVRSNI